MAATWIDSQAADRIWRSLKSFMYHFTVGELAASHTVTSRELLNEKKTIDRIGT